MRFRLNGREVDVDAPPMKRLLDVLREECGLTGTKHGCELGECGTCTVLVDGKTTLSCLVLAETVEGKTIETAAGLANGTLDPLQEAFMDRFAAQCGYCTPGMLVAARALLNANPNPSREDVIEAISGNLCRCTGYSKIMLAVRGAEMALSEGD